MEENFKQFLLTKPRYTARNYYKAVKKFENWMAASNLNLNCLDKPTLQGYITHLCQTLKPVSIQVEWAGIKCYLEFLDKTIPHIVIPKTIRQEAKYLDKQQRAEFVKATSSMHQPFKTIARLLILTGMRIGEIVNLKTSDIVRIDNVPCLKVIGKGNKMREIPLTEAAYNTLANYLSKMDTNSSGKLFGVTGSEIRQAISRIGKKIGAEWLHPHSLRHTFITEQMERGMDSVKIAKVVGHSSTKITEIYAHPSKASLVKDMESKKQ